MNSFFDIPIFSRNGISQVNSRRKKLVLFFFGVCLIATCIFIDPGIRNRLPKTAGRSTSANVPPAAILGTVGGTQSQLLTLEPTLGNYPPTLVGLGQNKLIVPDMPPAGVTRISVTTSSDFNGLFEMLQHRRKLR